MLNQWLTLLMVMTRRWRGGDRHQEEHRSSRESCCDNTTWLPFWCSCVRIEISWSDLHPTTDEYQLHLLLYVVVQVADDLRYYFKQHNTAIIVVNVRPSCSRAFVDYSGTIITLLVKISVFFSFRKNLLSHEDCCCHGDWARRQGVFCISISYWFQCGGMDAGFGFGFGQY